MWELFSEKMVTVHDQTKILERRTETIKIKIKQATFFFFYTGSHTNRILLIHLNVHKTYEGYFSI